MLKIYHKEKRLFKDKLKRKKMFKILRRPNIKENRR